jgi:hypothetical protein
VRGDRLRDALAAGETGADKLAGVTLVDSRAGRANRFAAVPARDVQRPARFGRGVIDRPGFAGGQVDSVDATVQPDRVRARASAGELAFPGFEVGQVIASSAVSTGPGLGSGSGAMAAAAPLMVMAGCLPSAVVRPGG